MLFADALCRDWAIDKLSMFERTNENKMAVMAAGLPDSCNMAVRPCF